MRRLAYSLTILFLLGTPALSAEESVVSIDLYMGQAKPEDAKYIANMAGPTRSLTVTLRRPDTGMQKIQHVDLKGPLSTERVSSLLLAIFSHDDSYWSVNRPLVISIVGDDFRARVNITDVCGLLCGGGVSYFYTVDRGQWSYLYACDRWLS